VEEIHRDPLGFLRRLEAGEALLVLRGERPVAEVTPVGRQGEGTRPCGLAAGQFAVPGDFDEPLPAAIVSEFEGA